jgi:hypothetical protein
MAPTTNKMLPQNGAGETKCKRPQKGARPGRAGTRCRRRSITRSEAAGALPEAGACGARGSGPPARAASGGARSLVLGGANTYQQPAFSLLYGTPRPFHHPDDPPWTLVLTDGGLPTSKQQSQMPRRRSPVLARSALLALRLLRLLRLLLLLSAGAAAPPDAPQPRAAKEQADCPRLAGGVRGEEAPGADQLLLLEAADSCRECWKWSKGPAMMSCAA